MLQDLSRAQGLLNPAYLQRALLELQGIRMDVIDGAAAGTKMNVTALRTDDTLVQAVRLTDTWAAPTSDLANITIQSTKASGTITITGNPVADETLVVNGVTYTWKATPAAKNHVKITAGNNTQMATDLAAAINAYENRYESQLRGDSNRTAAVVATSNAGVVTVTSVIDGSGATPTVTGTVTVLAATNSGTAQATLTCATVVADNTFSVNGVTFTAKATPTGDVQFAVKASNALQAIEIARVINAYQNKYATLGMTAVAVGAAVNITPVLPVWGNLITLTESSTNVAVSGSGTLTNGTDTGGIKSTTDLSTSTLLLTWFKKPAVSTGR